MLGELF